MKELVFLDDGWEDYLFWQVADKRILKKINKIITEIKRAPFEGIGKPEPLRFELSGLWSRRITSEHRIIYKVESDKIIIVQCKNHY